MKRSKILMLGFSLTLLAFGCKEQKFTEDEVGQQTQAKLKKEEFGKYNYSSVKLPYASFTAARFLTVDLQFQQDKTNSFSVQLPNSASTVNIKSVTDAKAELGRVLFYDNNLSLNNKVSCASCHNQAKGFADGKQFSEGFEGRKTTRNSMGLSNLGMTPVGLFWDIRADCVKNLALEPVKNHIEMGMEDLGLLKSKLKSIEYYPALFEKAYGTSEVTEDRIAEGFNAFLRSFVSWDSKFDQGVPQGFSNFTPAELEGRKIFTDISGANCVSCHGGSNFDDHYNWGGSNIGLDAVSADKGISNGNFKIPSLRNVELTAPYMHDGRFKSLEEVVNHYSENIKMNPSLHWGLRDPNSPSKAKKLNLTDSQKQSLVAFLKTLTDKKFISDPKYSDPFER